MVPHFKRLSDFMLARKWYMRALRPFAASEALAKVYIPGSERSDSELRMRRHKATQPEISFLQIPFKPSHEYTLINIDLHKPYILRTSAGRHPPGFSGGENIRPTLGFTVV